MPPVSQPPQHGDQAPNANAAYLAALNLMGPGTPSPLHGAAPTTGPQPVPLSNDAGPLGTAPSNARALGYPDEGQVGYGARLPHV